MVSNRLYRQWVIDNLGALRLRIYKLLHVNDVEQLALESVSGGTQAARGGKLVGSVQVHDFRDDRPKAVA